MDVTILSANASQLKVILKEPDSEYYTLLLVLVSISMILQVFTAYRHSLISAVLISAIFDLPRFIILAYFPPL